jgi:hypothetical protein
MAGFSRSLSRGKMCCQSAAMALGYGQMDTPRSNHVDRVRLFAMLCLLIGWFFLDTLVVSLGSLRHGVRFFDISSAIADPTRIFFGVDGYLQRILFGFLCAACLLSPLLPQWRPSRGAWLASLAPLGLMVVCGALLYSKTSAEFFSTPADAHTLGSGVIRLANDLVHRGSGLVARHVSIGAGGYVAFGGSLLAAVQGVSQFRRQSPLRPTPSS